LWSRWAAIADKRYVTVFSAMTGTMTVSGAAGVCCIASRRAMSALNSSVCAVTGTSLPAQISAVVYYNKAVIYRLLFEVQPKH
jgi:hypothetical protein